MKPEMLFSHPDRAFLLQEFHSAPLETWFSQNTVAAVRGCSVATVERDRWAGLGIPFIKCGRSVRYTKKAILDWLEKHTPTRSTTEYQNLK